MVFLSLAALFVLDSCSSNEEAKMAADAYVASMNTFDVSKYKVSSRDDYFVACTSIRNNPLLSDEEKQQAEFELWQRYYFVSIGGNEDNICFAGNSYGYLYNNDEILRNLIDKGLDRFGQKYINKEFDKLVETSDAYKRAISEGWCSENDFKHNIVAKTAAIYCLNMNKVLLDAAKWITVMMARVQNHDEILDLKKQYTSKFLTPSGSMVSVSEEKSAKLFYFKYYSHEQLLQLPTYYGLMNGMLGEIFEVAASKYQ